MLLQIIFNAGVQCISLISVVFQNQLVKIGLVLNLISKQFKFILEICAYFFCAFAVSRSKFSVSGRNSF